MSEVEGGELWTSPGGKALHSRFLEPVPITRDNLKVVIDAGWVPQEVVCKGVAVGSVPACK